MREYAIRQNEMRRRQSLNEQDRASGQNSYVESLETITTPKSREQANYNKQSKESSTSSTSQKTKLVDEEEN